ncbi:antiviral innate immune response receptor RIG-I isoform X2 [Xenopus laevis]|uniref:RNA helicase n=1 Tax=Xenopus laevis TaxID=8355 RepID=A0A8J0UYZ5_XENLA|nr:antiviral innate immune response receptor RIG-I isoform X2 [Xenopus laevis]
MSQEEKETLKRFSNYITGILIPNYVIDYMATWLSADTIEQIKELKGPTQAATVFLDKLLQLEERGWYRGFLDVLNTTGYTGLGEALTKSDFGQIEALEEPKRLLQTIRNTVKSNINPSEFVPLFDNCLLTREIEEIKQEITNKGDTAGTEKLIDSLLRSDKQQWPKVFTLALEDLGHSTILELWANKECSSAHKICAENVEEDTSVFSIIQYSQVPEEENLFHSAPAVQSNQVANDVPKINTPPGSVSQSDSTMKLRNYQEELAKPAYAGKNTMICAPTGSGKTLVSIAICKHHLENMPNGKKGKVVFMTTKVPVYEQQLDVFCRYFAHSRYKVEGFSGETAENLPVGLVVENSDIIILTPQILVNCLESGTVPSLSVFSMMIFDECHNTIGNHPYNVLMFSYLDLKLNMPGEALPQIIGLTASVGTGKAKTLEEAKMYVTRLCASLNIGVISTVNEHKEELDKFVNQPKKFVKIAEPRENDAFTAIMSEIMKETEKMAKDLFPELCSMSNIQNWSYGTQKYEQWIIDTQKKCRVLQMDDKNEEMRICSALFTYTEHLRKYNDSIMINEDARTKDALDYLENFFNNMKNGSFNDIEQKLYNKFQEKLPELLEVSNNNINKKLEELQFILEESYHENPETRSLLFVKTRALVSALKTWIEENPVLQFLKPEILIGRSKRNESIGMTLTSQKGALEAFKNSGDSKLLIATSVADEGIDIQACNLVLLYEYVGNVTKMIQVRGRGRAKDSNCFLVTSKREEAIKEKNNLLRETLMNDAVTQMQKEEPGTFLSKILKIQKEEKQMRDMKKLFEKPKETEGNRKLLCGKCKTFACNTDDIRVIKVSHHTVIDKTFKDRYITKNHPKPRTFQGYKKIYKIFCKKPGCNADWGVSGTYQCFQDIPLIKIEEFVIENPDGTQDYKNRWVDVHFTMTELSTEDLPLSFSTCN